MCEKVSLEAYNILSEHYFKDVDNNIYNGLYDRPGIIELLPSIEEKIILDAGCAAGWYSNYFIQNNALEVTSLDFSLKMLEKVKQRIGNSNKIKYLQHDLNNDFDSELFSKFDLIVSSLTLHYIKDLKKVFCEFKKLLKENGHLVFSVHHPFMDFYECSQTKNYFDLELLNDYWRTRNGKVQVHYYRRPLSEILNPLIEADFIIEKVNEPKPSINIKEKSESEYNRLSNNPQFLFIRAKSSSL